MKQPQLVCDPAKDSSQFLFETNCIRYLNLNHGIFGVNVTDNYYINEYVQWLWAQFLKGQ